MRARFAARRNGNDRRMGGTCATNNHDGLKVDLFVVEIAQSYPSVGGGHRVSLCNTGVWVGGTYRKGAAEFPTTNRGQEGGSGGGSEEAFKPLVLRLPRTPHRTWKGKPGKSHCGC